MTHGVQMTMNDMRSIDDIRRQ